MGEDNGIYGIDKLAELLIARGIKFCVMNEYSLIFVDGKGNLHECCRAGTEDLVNVMIVTTPEEALSVTDLNGVIAENGKLRELFYEAWEWMQRARHDGSIRADEMDEIGAKAVELGFPDHELGIEVDG